MKGKHCCGASTPNRQRSPHGFGFAILAASVCMILAGCHSEEYANGKGASATRRAPFEGVPTRKLREECVTDYNPLVDYFPEKETIQYAQVFSIEYHKHFKVLKLSAPRTSESRPAINDTIVLVQCGTPAPELKGPLAGATVITIPVMSIAANENSDVTAVKMLGADDKLIAIGSGQIYDESVRRRWQSHELATVGPAWHGLPNSEPLIANPPDVFFMRRATLEQGYAVERSRSMGILSVPTLGVQEPHYLGYAEWLKFIALFLNRESEAEQIFARVASRSAELTKMALADKVRPRAIWAGPAAGATWDAARSPRDWRTLFLRDAGADNPLFDADARPRDPIPLETFISKSADADIWISDAYLTNGWPSPRLLGRIEAYRNGAIYHHEKRTDFTLNAFDWYETGAMRPDLVLEDLVALFHPHLLPDHEQMFFAKVELAAAQ